MIVSVKMSLERWHIVITDRMIVSLKGISKGGRNCQYQYVITEVAYLLAYLLTYLLACFLPYLLTYSLTYLLPYLLTRLLTYVLA